MRVSRVGWVVVFGVLASPAFAQPPTVDESTTSDRREIANAQKDNQDIHYIGHVELHRDKTDIYADEAWFNTATNRFVAAGNVLYSEGSNRISAERVEFDTEARIGTFYKAWGMASVQPQRPQARGGFTPPPMAGQETVVYFFGDRIDKVGPKKYEITNGGFSTCVQPTPRWELHADTVTLNVDHYTMLRNAVLSVKGVPLFYVPILYYPTKREGRATGFLIPTYGSSSLRGQSIHNAFFWAIDRSQDATFVHDWYSKTGQGTGSEYRYNFGGGDDGNIRAYLLDQQETLYPQADGTTRTLSAHRDYDIHGSANQLLPGNLRARGRIDYFSSIISSQTFNTNIYDISRNQRTIGGNVVGAWSSYTLNATFDHSEYFTDVNNSSLVGGFPRVSLSRNERPIAGSAAYFSLGTEYANLLRSRRSSGVDVNESINRLDFVPQIRYPFKKWQWFTVNSTFSWRDTYYTRTIDPLTQQTVDDPLNRRFYTLQAQIVGPVFNRVWDTPENGYAEKFKHTIEPFLSVSRISTIDNVERIPRFDGTDTFFGGTQYVYGVNNRFYAKRKPAPTAPAVSREILSVELSQTYYTNQTASQFDPRYTSTSYNATTPEHFTPFALNIRAVPINDFNASVRVEFDSRYHVLRTLSAQGVYSWTGRLQTSAGWTKRSIIPQRPDFSVPNQALTSTSSLHTLDNRLGTTYTFNYDVVQSRLLNQSITGFYNAQCCGLAFQYQAYNYGGLSSLLPIPSDHRFFLSFTLAGLGNFSPFNGALGGVPR